MDIKGYIVPLFCDIIGFLVSDESYEVVFSLPGEDSTFKMDLDRFIVKFCKYAKPIKEIDDAEER